jgi:hypothetical protein
MYFDKTHLRITPSWIKHFATTQPRLSWRESYVFALKNHYQKIVKYKYKKYCY